MASHFFPLMRRREFEWKENLRSEVLEVVTNFSEDKAPRPNGFSMAFFFLGGIKREHYGSVQGVL